MPARQPRRRQPQHGIHLPAAPVAQAKGGGGGAGGRRRPSASHRPALRTRPEVPHRYTPRDGLRRRADARGAFVVSTAAGNAYAWIGPECVDEAHRRRARTFARQLRAYDGLGGIRGEGEGDDAETNDGSVTTTAGGSEPRRCWALGLDPAAGVGPARPPRASRRTTRISRCTREENDRRWRRRGGAAVPAPEWARVDRGGSRRSSRRLRRSRARPRRGIAVHERGTRRDAESLGARTRGIHAHGTIGGGATGRGGCSRRGERRRRGRRRRRASAARVPLARTPGNVRRGRPRHGRRFRARAAAEDGTRVDRRGGRHWG